jgi:peroxiredoxin
MPDFEQVHQQYKDRVVLFGLDVGPFVGLGSREDGKKLIEELGITYPTGTTFDAEVVSEYGVLGMPTTIFIKPNGKIVKKWTGLLNKSKMTELVEELLAASGKP